MTAQRRFFSLELELESLPLPAWLLSAHGTVWSSHMLLGRKFYRLPHSILEPFAEELSVGIGGKSSRHCFCSPPANSLGNVIALGHALSQPCCGVGPYECMEQCRCTWILCIHRQALGLCKGATSGAWGFPQASLRSAPELTRVYSSPTQGSRIPGVVGRIMGPQRCPRANPQNP